LLVPLIMLNACLTFSWPNKVPFDHEASGIIQAGIYTGAQTGAGGGMTGTQRVSPRASKPTPGYQAVPGYCGSSLCRDVYQNSVIGDLSDPDGEAWFV
jgi:hypothetical protein